MLDLLEKFDLKKTKAWINGRYKGMFRQGGTAIIEEELSEWDADDLSVN